MATPKRVLLIDDDDDMLLTNRMALEAAGYEVGTALSGKEGLAKARAGEFDVVVLDVMMETRDEGFDVARSLRSDPTTGGVRILMLTSVNDDANRRGSPVRFSDRDRDPSWLPVDRFVEKPLKPSRLVEIVAELSAGSRG